MIDERSIVNAIVGLMATGGSTNHALHIPAIAAAAGIRLDLEDLSDLSAVTPLLARIYPNGPADVNHFHAAGGMGFLMKELLSAGLIHGDALGVHGTIAAHCQEPFIEGDDVVWRAPPDQSGDLDILRPASAPFSSDGGLKLMAGNLGRGVSKVSAVKAANHIVEAPARVFSSQETMKAAFEAGELNQDVVVVVRFQGPSANGMPELHSLTPALGVLQDRGHSVALVTDGRMSGASGKVPSAIHISPEAARGGPLARVKDGDVIRFDAVSGQVAFMGDEVEFEARAAEPYRPNDNGVGLGREMFSSFRGIVGDAEIGASVFSFLDI